MKKKVTIHDLARILNIDSSTVSRALNNSPRVGAETKKRILAKAGELGYQRNLLASNLRTSKTMTIGVIVPFISRHFFSEAIDGIEQVVSEKNYRVIIAQSYDDFEKEKELVNGMFMNRIDGLLLSTTLGTKDGKHLSIFLDNEIPVVLFDRYYENARINIVRLDDRTAAYQVTDHLIKNGCRKLVHLAGNLNAVIYKERKRGFIDALKDNGLEYNGDSIHSIPLLPEYADEFIENVIVDKKNIPDGIVCANDVTALRVIKYINENTSLRIPGDISVTGFSNEPSSSIITPGLTTVDQHSFEMGKMAAKMLLNSIEDEEDYLSRQTVIVKSSLIIRDSSLRKQLEVKVG